MQVKLTGQEVIEIEGWEKGVKNQIAKFVDWNRDKFL